MINVAVVEGGAPSDAKACGAQLAADAQMRLGGAAKALLLVSPYRGVDHARLLGAVREGAPGVPLIGGTTYGGIMGPRLVEDAPLLLAWGGDVQGSAARANGLARDAFETGRACAAGAVRGLKGAAPKVFLLMHEPQMGDPYRLLDGARSVLGEGFPIVGGGTGTGFIMEQSPMSKQFADGKVLAGSAVGLALAGDFKTAFGFSHGAQPVSPEFTLTKSRGNILVEFDGRPALDVLREAVGVTGDRETGISFTAFLGFGVVTAGSEEFPVLGVWGTDCKERVLYCGTQVAEGARYRIVRMSPETILEETGRAARKALAVLGGKAKGAVSFDCYGRKLQLGAHGLIDAELKALHEGLGGAPMAGMYSGSEFVVLDAGRPSTRACYAHASTSFVLFGDA